MLPVHIGIIPDGNRRYAKEKNITLEKSYKKGIRNTVKMIKIYFKKGVKYITIYALSKDNMEKRDKKELEYLFKNFNEEFKKNSKKIRFPEGVKINFIGNRKKFPIKIKNAMKNLEKKTAKNDCHTLNIAIGYNGSEEIISTIKKISENVLKNKMSISDINEKTVKENLYTGNQPYLSMIIRTGGKKRLSDFMIYQSKYSELFFINSKIAEIKEKEMLSPIKKYEKINRTFGS